MCYRYDTLTCSQHRNYGNTVFGDSGFDRGYLGRGIVLGLLDDGRTAVQIYWIESRKMSHRRRLLVHDKEDNSVRVVCANKLSARSKADLEYTAMVSRQHWHVVANGPQAEPVIEMLCTENSLQGIGLATRRSSPIDLLVPRITGVTAIHRKRPAYAICVATPQKKPLPHELIRVHEFPEVPRGYGVCVTTYQGGDHEAVPFGGPPRLLAIPSSQNCLEQLWDFLPKDLRVGLAVKCIDLLTGRITVSLRSYLKDIDEKK